ncbi:MAG: hypothetical protein AB4062_21655 [Crocosphaera sp.]
MKGFCNKSLLIAGVSSLISLFIGLETTQASPLCYIVDGSGQTLDLSYLCNQNTIGGSIENNRQASNDNEQAGAILARRIANGQTNINIKVELDQETLAILGRRIVGGGGANQTSQRFYRGGVSVPSYGRQDSLIRRTVGLDDLSTPMKRTVGVDNLSTTPMRRTVGVDRSSNPDTLGSYVRNDYLIRRTVRLDDVSNPVSTNISTSFPIQYVLNRAGVMEVRQSTGYVRISKD